MIRALLFISIALSASAQQTFQFTAKTPSFPSSGSFRQVAIADFNGDGNPDLVFTDGSGFSIWVMLGDGTGKFVEAPGSRFHAGNGPMVVVAADFNNDGKLDLAVLNHFTEPLTFYRSAYAIFFGDGAGGFTPGPVQLTSAIADFLVTGDFNNDGVADLAFAGTDGVSILLGEGTGLFHPVGPPFGSAAVYLISGDFNNDGALDLAVSDSNASPLSIYLGKGTGMFVKPPAASTVPRNSFSAGVSGDWNHDGFPDLAIFGSSTVTTLLGDGKGGFQTAGTVPAPNSTLTPQAVADFDGDGNLDLLLVSNGGAIVLAGDGTGKFREAQLVAVPMPNSLVFAADVNRDGKPDVIAFNGNVNLNALLTLPIRAAPIQIHAFAGQASVPPIMVNTGSLPALTVRSDQPWAAYISGQVTVDPSALLPGIYQATLRFSAPGYFGKQVSVVLNIAAASGTLTKQSTIPISRANTNITRDTILADFNGDGKPDLLMQSLSSESLVIRLNDGAGNFGTAVSFPIVPFTFGLGTQAVADFDGDGKNDVVVLTGQGIVLYSGDGAGNLRPGRLTNIKYPASTYSVAVADFNGDGFADLIIDSSGDSPIRVFLNDGKANFREVPAPVSGKRVDFGGYRFQVEDYNGDGIPDLAFASDRGQAVYVAIGDGTGRFQIVQTVLLTDDDRGITLVSGDWNGDGAMDLAAVSTSIGRGVTHPNGVLTVLLGNNTGLFVPVARPLPSVRTGDGLVAADFDGDGILDLAVSTDLITTTLLFGDGTGAFLPRAGYVLPNSYAALTADLNGDGRADLVTKQLDGFVVYLGERSNVSLQLTQEPANPFTVGQTATFHVEFLAAPAFTAPTGTVSLFDGTVQVGSFALTAGGAPGTLRFTTPFLPGTHQFRAVYSGDARFSAASASLTSVETGFPSSVKAIGDSVPLRALVTDVKGDPVSSAGVIFAAPAFGASGTFNGFTSALAITDQFGIATAPPFTPTVITGSVTITAAVSGYPGVTATFQIKI